MLSLQTVTDLSLIEAVCINFTALESAIELVCSADEQTAIDRVYEAILAEE
jgi:hypothetical protein